MWADNSVTTNKIETIKTFLETRSKTMVQYISQHEKESVFILWYKSLYHSDLTTRGKRNKSTEGFERNLLYYLSVDEMNSLQQAFPEKQFESAKQSNIGLPDLFYNDLGIPRIHRRKGQQKEKHKWILLNDYMQVFLVNETLYYFSLEYTEMILNTLKKSLPAKWRKELSGIELQSDSFTSIELREAIHGLGTKDDSIFHSLRLNCFLNDTIIFLIEKSQDHNKLFILLEKNPKFFELLNLKDKEWSEKERLRRFKEREQIKEGLNISIPVRLYDNEWDDILLP